MKIVGQTVDEQTRCVHYHSEKDVVALKMYCCNKWYPCYQCHNENESHRLQPWPQEERMTHAIFCGVCRQTMSIETYQQVSSCPYCQTAFNPNCSLHESIYFE